MTLDKLLKYIKEVEHRTKRATPKPWIVDECNNCGETHVVEYRVIIDYGDYNSAIGGMREQILGCAESHSKSTKLRDCEFIANARSDVPELTKQLKRLLRKYKKLKRKSK